MTDETNAPSNPADVTPAVPSAAASTPDLTYGQKAVGLTFNPSGDERVIRIKQFYANIIDELAGPNGENLGDNGDKSLKGRILGRAINDAIGAQMWAVKAITYQF